MMYSRKYDVLISTFHNVLLLMLASLELITHTHKSTDVRGENTDVRGESTEVRGENTDVRGEGTDVCEFEV